MPEYDDLKMLELVEKFRENIINIQETRSAKLFKSANADLLKIYNLHLTSGRAFKLIEHSLKNMYASYNYAAAIVNGAIKKKFLDSDSAERLDECLEVMLNCCDIIIAALKKKRK